MRKYIHRVGRTARAGRTGEAWTLVEEQEVPTFCFYLPSTVTLTPNTGTLFQANVEGGRSS